MHESNIVNAIEERSGVKEGDMISKYFLGLLYDFFFLIIQLLLVKCQVNQPFM